MAGSGREGGLVAAYQHAQLITMWVMFFQAKAVKALLAHRLHQSDPQEAKLEWYTIVEGDHRLWTGVSEPYKV